MTLVFSRTVCSLRVLLLLAVVGGCADTGQAVFDVPLSVVGTDVAPFETTRGVTLTLDRADLAFGPLYLCSSVEAGEACDTARAEWLDSVVVDALDASAIEVGALRGTSGAYRSLMYDLGISSLLTRDQPVALDAAQALGGNSVVLEGRVELAGDSVPFALEMPIARSGDTELGVPMVRVRLDAASSHAIDERDRSLQVAFDPRAWVEAIDFATLCADADDCQRLSSQGQAGRALRNALTAGRPPVLHWNLAADD